MVATKYEVLLESGSTGTLYSYHRDGFKPGYEVTIESKDENGNIIWETGVIESVLDTTILNDEEENV